MLENNPNSSSVEAEENVCRSDISPQTVHSAFCFPSMVSDTVSWPGKEGEPEREPERVNAGVEEEETLGDLERSLMFTILCFANLFF